MNATPTSSYTEFGEDHFAGQAVHPFSHSLVPNKPSVNVFLVNPE